MRYKYITKIENKFDKKKTPEGLLSKKIKKCLSNSRAWGHLASYLVMFLISAVLGAKYYPIPYQWKRLGAVILVMLALFALSRPVDGWFSVESTGEGVLKEGSFWLKMLVHTALIAAYALAAYKILGGRKALRED